MSLETLLEAARFIELQEHAASHQQHQQPVLPTLATPSTPTTQSQPITIHLPAPAHQLRQSPPHLVQATASPQQQMIALAATSPNNNAPCIIPCVANGAITSAGVTVTTSSGGNISTNGSIIGTARSIVLTATPLRVKQVDHTVKQQIIPSNNQFGNTANIPVHGIINNSFDIINPLFIDDQGGARRKQPPLVFRSGTREVHNKLEKCRRAHLKECFDVLKQQLPATDEKKTSNLSILHSALRHIKALQKAERDSEQERDRLDNERLLQQQRVINLQKELAVSYGDNKDLIRLLDNTVQPDLISNQSPVLNGNLVVKSEEFIACSNNILQRAAATSTPPASSLATLAINGLKQEARTVTINGFKEGLGSTTFVPISGAPLLIQKVTLLPKTPLSFTTAQPVNGNTASAQYIHAQPHLANKVLPLVTTNGTAAKYVVKPMVVVSTPSRTS